MQVVVDHQNMAFFSTSANDQDRDLRKLLTMVRGRFEVGADKIFTAAWILHSVFSAATQAGKEEQQLITGTDVNRHKETEVRLS